MIHALPEIAEAKRTLDAIEAACKTFHELSRAKASKSFKIHLLRY